jgi:putative FmdB family regulatory protein
MPIYEYRCESCSFQEEYLQKVSEPPKTVCPSCGKETFRKMVSAAGFQLKGSGWYVTDFRNKSGGSSSSASASGKAESSDKTASSGEAAATPAPAASTGSGSGSDAA